MTVRTVEQEETVTTTEDVALCDTCGQSTDAGELHEVTELPGPTRHYHRECVPTIDGEVPVTDSSQTVADAAASADVFGGRFVVIRKTDYIMLWILPVLSIPATIAGLFVSVGGMLILHIALFAFIYWGSRNRADKTGQELFDQQD